MNRKDRSRSPEIRLTSTTNTAGKLNAEERTELPDSAYGLPQRREYPMPDAAHVRAAEVYFRYCPEELKPLLARNIIRKAEEFGVHLHSNTVLSYASR